MIKYFLAFFSLTFNIIILKAQIVNETFQKYKCGDGDLDPFYTATTCSLTPWLISHGSPQIYLEYEGNNKNWFASMAGGHPPTGHNPLSEGLIYPFTFEKGKAYTISFRYRALPNEYGQPADNTTKNAIDLISVMLTNGVNIRTVPEINESYAVPPIPTSRQVVLKRTNAYETQWVSFSTVIFPFQDFSQLWFYTTDDNTLEGTRVNGGFFDIDDVKITCGQDNKEFTADIPTGLTQASNQITLDGSATTQSGQAYYLKAGNQISILPNTSIVRGSNFDARSGSISCANENSVCSVLSDINIPNLVTPNGDGKNEVFALNDKNKSIFAFSASKIYLEIKNRWESVVYCHTYYAKDYGTDGFQNSDITWDPNNPYVVDGVYFYYIRIYNCNGTVTENCIGTCKGCLTVNEGEENLKFTEYGTDPNNNWIQVIRGVGRLGNNNNNNFINNSNTFYPNPATSSVTVEPEFGTPTIVKVESINGSTVSEYQISAKTEIDVSSLNSGMYIISFITNEKTERKRLEIIK